MKKVISFCLWGDNPTYTIGAIKQSALAKKHFPGWICRFYVADCVSEDIINTIKSQDNTEIVKMGHGDWTAMFWRFYPASDPDVEVMISRDTDSRLNSREAAAVNEWLKSEKDFHIMRDHPHHDTEILGGMWGVKNPLLQNMEQLIDDYVKGDFWQVDQNFLREIIYPKVKNTSLSHDPYFTKYGDTLPFPTERQNKEFVGDVFDENDSQPHNFQKYII